MSNNIALGTQYELNKQAIGQLTPMSKETFSEKTISMSLWVSSRPFENKYFMFLCNDLHDYTIFNFETTNYEKGREELKKLIASRGIPVSIDYNSEQGYYEVWVKKKGQIYMYLFFDCTDFIIEV